MLRILIFYLLAIGMPASAQIRVGVVASSRHVPAQTYYISPSGNDANAGTSPASAWQTITKVNATAFHPGDSILFQGGQTFSGNLVINESGEEGAPIVVGSYGAGRAQINAAGTDHGIKVHNQEYVEIRELIVNGPGAQGALVCGISFYNGTDQQLYGNFIDSVTVQNFGFFGVWITSKYEEGVSAVNKKGFTDFRIWNSLFTENGIGGLQANGSWDDSLEYVIMTHRDLHVKNCRASRNPGRNGNRSGAPVNADWTGGTWTHPWSGSGIIIAGCRASLMEYCVADSNAYANIGQGCVGLWISECDSTTIRYCEAYKNQNGGVNQYDGAGFDMDGSVTNSVIEYCYSHDNDGPGYMFIEWGSKRDFKNNIMRYCVSVNDAAGNVNGGNIAISSLDVTQTVDSMFIYNNTIYVPDGGTAFSTGANAYGTGVQYRNNIVYFADDGWAMRHMSNVAFPIAQYSFNHNLYYSHTNATISYRYGGATFTTLAAYQAGSGYEAAGLNVNPMLANPGNASTIGMGNPLSGLTAYQLIAGSPAIAAGVTISGAPATDFYGNPLAGSVNIGAHDNSSTATSYTITDSDASAYVTAAALTSNVQKWAVDQYVQDLKAAGVWTKMKAIYPFLGGTAASHKWNLKDPRDLDAAYRIVFSGGSHSATGYETDGVDDYGDTKFVSSTSGQTLSSAGVSVYSTNHTKFSILEVWGDGAGDYTELAIAPFTGTACWVGREPYAYFTDADRRGFYVANRNSATNTQAWKNGTKQLDAAQDNTTMVSAPIWLGVSHSTYYQVGNPWYAADTYHNALYTYAAAHTGMTDAEVANYTTAVNSFQRRLGRATY